VLFQLPPFLKKDLPRLREFLQLCRRDHRALRVPPRQLVRRRRCTPRCRLRRRAVPVRARETPSRHRWSNRNLGLCRPAPGAIFRRRLGAMGCAACGRRPGRTSTSTSCMSRPRRPTRRPCCWCEATT
jgi:hypothetical protein